MKNRSKTFFTCLCLAVLVLAALTKTSGAQENEEPKITVEYKFIHLRDTLDRSHPYWEHMALYLGKENGVYKSFNMIAARRAVKKHRQEGTDWNKDPDIKYMVAKSNTDLLFYQPKKQLLLKTTRLLATDYIFDETYPKIKWSIGKNKKQIGGYECQDATGFFAGRTYTAWFTRKIPYPLGPWKLVGLPGLILEAYDQKGEVRFDFEAIIQGSAEQGEFVGLSDVSVRKSEEEIKRIYAMIEKDPTAAYNAAMDQAERYKREGKNAYSKDQRIVAPMGRPGDGGSLQIANPLELKKENKP
jgi:GLPGLI family protein